MSDHKPTKRTPRGKGSTPTVRKIAPYTPWMPTISYENCVLMRAREIDARLTRPDDTPERVAMRFDSSVANQRERLETWQTLGEHYAAMLEDSATSQLLHSAIAEELLDLVDRAHLGMTSPCIIRLLYPMLREAADRFERFDVS